MKLKTLAVLAVSAMCAGSLAMAGTTTKSSGANKMLADDTSSQSSTPSTGGTDNSSTGGTDNSQTGGSPDNMGGSQDNSAAPSGDDNSNGSTDTGTGDDDY